MPVAATDIGDAAAGLVLRAIAMVDGLGPLPPLRRLYALPPERPLSLVGAAVHLGSRHLKGATMADILVAVLGTGGILLMAAYAALCERI